MTNAQLIAQAISALLFAILLWATRRDVTEYQRFKALTETKDRQRVFWRWIVRSFLMFCVTGVAGLALLGRLDALSAPPAELRALLTGLHFTNGEWGDFLIGFASSALLVAAAGALAWRLRKKPDAPVVVGDIEALLPRNGAERWCAFWLSVNAGVSEEIAFRAFLPVLFLTAFGGAALPAVLLAALTFGLMHAYQGLIGVAVTTLVGLVMTFLYVASGSLWVPVALHIALDLNGLLLQPALRGAARRPAS